MLTQKENFLETLKKNGKPDRLVNQYQPFVPIMNDPLQRYTRGNRVRGTTSVDKWGTEILFPEDAPGPMPHVTNENKVCPDITRWREYVKVPDLQANCSEGWEDALEQRRRCRPFGKTGAWIYGHRNLRTVPLPHGF